MLLDNYEHSDGSVLYTPANIPGPGIDLNVYDEQFEGCGCLFSCGVDCSCKRHCGVGYYKDGLLNVNDPMMIYECHENCNCGVESCGNRLVQKGPHPMLEIVKTSMKGLGLYCKVDLKKGSFVCEYAGEVIGKEEARLRYGRQQMGDKNYIFALREHFGSNMLLTYIDPTYIGNIGRYINHSCDPNLLIVPVRTDTTIPKLCLFANRDITSCTELTFDYGGGAEPAGGHHATGSDCYCGTAVCRGTLPFDSSLC